MLSERVQQRTVKQFVDVPVHRSWGGIVEIVWIIPPGATSRSASSKIFNELVSQFLKEIVEMTVSTLHINWSLHED